MCAASCTASACCRLLRMLGLSLSCNSRPLQQPQLCQSMHRRKLALLSCQGAVRAPGDRTIAGVLLDAPALPQPAVADFLRDVARSGGDWSTLALSAGARRRAAAPRPTARLFWQSSWKLRPAKTQCSGTQFWRTPSLRPPWICVCGTLHA